MSGTSLIHTVDDILYYQIHDSQPDTIYSSKISIAQLPKSVFANDNALSSIL